MDCPEGTTEISRWRKPPDRSAKAKHPGGVPEPSLARGRSRAPAGAQPFLSDDPGAADAGASLPPANFPQPSGLPAADQKTGGVSIQFRHLWGKNKRGELLETLGKPRGKIYETLKPAVQVGLPFLPSRTEAGYFKWPLLTELLPVSFPGVQDGPRRGARRDGSRHARSAHGEILRRKNQRRGNQAHRSCADGKDEPFRCESGSQFSARAGNRRGRFVRFNYRPFDVRWLYWEPETKLLDEKRTDYLASKFLTGILHRRGSAKPERFFTAGNPRQRGCRHIIERGANFFPLQLCEATDTQSASVKETPDMFAFEGGGGGDDETKPNLTTAASTYLAKVEAKPDALFFHIVAALHAPDYREENAGALRQDWPRVPLPKSRKALLASADLGRQIAALLDTETPVPGVTQGKPRAELKPIAELSYTGTADFQVTAGWGHAGQGGVTMPGKGNNHRYAPLTAAESMPAFGATTLDIYLNETACWRNVPERVWNYTLGGYQVLKKWLSYREHDLLGRALTADEAREFTHNARRIAALILLQPELDANYQGVKADTFTWK